MIEYAQISEAGGRPDNEDSVDMRKTNGGLCAVLADGLGGYGGGKAASMEAVETLLEQYQAEMIEEPASIHRVIQEAHERVLGLQTAACPMKSTVVLFMLERDRCRWAHVGDSRLYHFTRNGLQTRTIDHSVSQMAVLMGEIREEEIRFHEDRNRVLRALGNAGELKSEISPVLPLEEEFHAFLLCSDGFWEYVLEIEMEIELCRARSPRQWLGAMESRLRKKASGDFDNYSAAAVFVNNEARPLI